MEWDGRSPIRYSKSCATFPIPGMSDRMPIPVQSTGDGPGDAPMLKEAFRRVVDQAVMSFNPTSSIHHLWLLSATSEWHPGIDDRHLPRNRSSQLELSGFAQEVIEDVGD